MSTVAEPTSTVAEPTSTVAEPTTVKPYAVDDDTQDTSDIQDTSIQVKALPRSWRDRIDELVPDGWSWPSVFWLGIIHAGVFAAPFFFSWSGLALAVVFHWFTGGVGICLGFHRFLTHDSFKTILPVKYLLATIGGWAGEGACVTWVANHRKHHAFSDQEGDPHSPEDGAWWSHIIWTVKYVPADKLKEHCEKWCPDLTQDRGLIWIDRAFLLSHFLLGITMGAIGYALGGGYLAASWVIWGMFLRLTFVLHSTWFVNSASHMWGYRNYETRDDSRNNWWVAILTYGEGWHNNHHAYPRMANHGHQWWEFDVTYNTIRLMKLCGVAWDVVDYKRKGTD